MSRNLYKFMKYNQIIIDFVFIKFIYQHFIGFVIENDYFLPLYML
jgi:hypothetical protein